MSDYLSGLFLLGTIIASAILIPLALFAAIIRKKITHLSMVSLGIVFTLLFIWVADRVIAGMFCLPWECVNRDIPLETGLLNDADLPDLWNVKATSNYVYVPRGSINYRERTFEYTSPPKSMVFYEEIYQYRSIRGASFQYQKLKKELPTSYSIESTPISPLFELQVKYASEYDFGCVFHKKNTTCYYLARYNEYVLLLEMPFQGDSISGVTFTEIVGLADKKFSSVVGKQ
jgi:hypothetical protein